MKIQEIKDLALSITHTKDSQIPDDAELHRFFNLGRKRVIERLIRDLGENYYYDSAFIDGEKDRLDGKYPLPKDSEGRQLFSKILGVYIKRSTGQRNRVKALEVDPRAPGFDWEIYLEGTTEVFFVTCKDIFVAPQFQENVPNAIKITGILAPHDLDINADESEIAVPEEAHEAIAWAMAPYIYKYRGKDELAMNAYQEFEMIMKEAIANLTNKVDDDFIRRIPNDF